MSHRVTYSCEQMSGEDVIEFIYHYVFQYDRKDESCSKKREHTRSCVPSADVAPAEVKRHPAHPAMQKVWTARVSIPVPPACEAGALPSELAAQGV